MSVNNDDVYLSTTSVVEEIPPKQLFDPIYFVEPKLKSTLLIKNDDPHVKITIEDDSQDVYMKYEPLGAGSRSFNPFVCPICKYEAGGGCSFQLHMMIHTDGEYYNCISCNYCAPVVDLVRHVFKMHTSEYYSFNDVHAAQTHHRKPSYEDAVWECDKCGFKTNTEGYYQRHLRTHLKGNKIC